MPNNNITPYFSAAATATVNENQVMQYAAVADLPTATGMTDGTLAFVKADLSFYRVSSGAWVKSTTVT